MDGNLLKMGMTIYEDNTDFWGLKQGNMHMFHYLEFLVYGYTAFHNIITSMSDREDSNHKEDGESLALLGQQIQIPWVHAPYLSRRELRGSHETNQLFTNLVFGGGSHNGGEVILRGMEDNDEITRQFHSSFRGVEPHTTRYPLTSGIHKHWRQLFMTYWRQWRRTKRIPALAVRQRNFEEMTASVDAVLYINRHQCDAMGVGQMHAKLAGTTPSGGESSSSESMIFPANAWSQDIRNGLNQLILLSNDPTTTTSSAATTATADADPSFSKLLFTVCYIDRQSAPVRRMPKSEHDWLLSTLQNHPRVHFLQLQMEKLAGIQQIQMATSCNMILGVHGNGLSHELWMLPASSIVEYYWGEEQHYVYCYSIMALMMKHKYLGFWNGKPIPTQRVQRLDPDLNKYLQTMIPTTTNTTTTTTTTESHHRTFFLEFLNQEIARWQEKEQKEEKETAQ